MSKPLLSPLSLVAAGLFCLAGAAHGEKWEATLTPFTPGSFPQPRAVHAQYAFGWSGLTAATVDVHFGKASDDRYKLEGKGGTVGLARATWRYDLNHTALADAQTLRPISVTESEKTRSKEKNTEVAFSPELVVSLRQERKSGVMKTRERRFEFPNALSLESALLFLRSQPMPAGTAYRVVVYPATSSYLCTLTVKGREKITVPAGTYDAIKLDVQLSKIGEKRELIPHKKFSSATVWLSDDSDRLVLRVEAQVFVGTVFAELRSAEYEKPKP
ncbi:MAG: DUF3108 domain-containing protein [Chthoniobacterales bacterium]